MRGATVLAAALAMEGALLLGHALMPGHLATAHAADTSSLLELVYTATAKYDALAWMRGGERFPLGATLMLDKGLPAQVSPIGQPLVKNFAASADASVSFDGKSVLFAGKKQTADHWQIWEVLLATAEPRQLTRGTDDCVRPFYLPEGRIVYARHVADKFVIEALRLVDGQIVRLTYAAAMPTDVLKDGRVLFEAGWPLGNGKTPEIYTVYSDGSGVEAYRCDHPTITQQGAATIGRYAGRQIGTGDVVFANAHGLARFTSSLAHEVAVAAPRGEYAGEVAQLPSGEWVLPWRAEDRAKHFALVRWTSGTTTLTPVSADTRRDLVEPAVVLAHATPNQHPTALHDWSYANLLALNVATSRETMPAGKATTVRARAMDANGTVTALGDASIAGDGSFFVQVPGDKLVQFELRRANGTVLRRERGWMWARGGEQRICVGCHAGPERASENAVPAILDRSTDPTILMGAHAVTPASSVAGAKHTSQTLLPTGGH